jgi:hypothetical protein
MIPSEKRRFPETNPDRDALPQTPDNAQSLLPAFDGGLKILRAKSRRAHGVTKLHSTDQSNNDTMLP